MANRTRQLFVDYETRARGRTITQQKLISQEWAAKSVPQRQTIVSRIQDLLDCTTIHEKLEIRAGRNAGLASNVRNTAVNASYYAAMHSIAVENNEQVRKAMLQEADAYDRLGDVLQQQNGNHVTIEMTAAYAAYLRQMLVPNVDTEIDRLEQIQDSARWTQFPPGTRKADVGLMSKKCYARRQKAKVGIARTNFAPGFTQGNGTWTPWVSLGGGMSSSDLWIEVDANLNIRDRAARKDVGFGAVWYDARNWSGQVNDEDNRQPLELSCHAAMDSVTTTVVTPHVNLTPQNMRGLVDKTLKCFRLYNAWCGRGSLRDIIDDHHNSQRPIPEPFIWSVAESLMECAFAMEMGHDDLNNPNPVAGWKQIVHRDLKPDNLFMTEPREGHFHHYPEAKVGDWGLAMYTSATDPNNPSWYQDAGTEGFRAPEISKFVNQQTLQPVGHRISSCTNVWGVGIILYCLMTNQIYPEQPDWYGNPTHERMYDPANNPDFAHYSQHLRRLLSSCLHPNAATRGSPTQLLTNIRHALNNFGPATHKGMMNNTANLGVVMANGLRYALVDDYALGLAIQGLPPPTAF